MENELLKIQHKIKLIKDTFQKDLSKALDLKRVSAPMLVLSEEKLNDYLASDEKPVSFFSKSLKKEVEVVQSLAKWKRLALKRYNISSGLGIYTDMNAIRPNEELDQTHSLYVDQWDWEKRINKNNLNLTFLKEEANKVYKALLRTYKFLVRKYKSCKFGYKLPKEIFFISSADLEKMYPGLSPEERENEIAKKEKVVFITGIGYNLSCGFPHSKRAFDYDNWNLNGDLLVFHEKLNKALEISSMGIRVDSNNLIRQSDHAKEKFDENLPYYKMILEDNVLSIGGGIGQSRLCQLLLNKKHIGEVQTSLWNIEDTKKYNLL